MSDPQAFFDDFIAAIDRRAPQRIAPYLTAQSAASRTEIYRKARQGACAKALASLYPAVHRLLGEENFERIAHLYRERHPPVRATLSLYGEAFPDFLAAFGPVREQLPFLGDVARLDQAWFSAYRGEDAPGLSAEALAALDPEALPELAPGLHVCASLYAFDEPIYSIWRTNKDDAEVRSVRLDGRFEGALIWRVENAVRHAPLSRAEHAFVNRIAAGGTFSEGYDAAIEVWAEIDFAELAAKFLTSGVFGSISD